MSREKSKENSFLGLGAEENLGKLKMRPAPIYRFTKSQTAREGGDDHAGREVRGQRASEEEGG